MTHEGSVTGVDVKTVRYHRERYKIDFEITPELDADGMFTREQLARLKIIEVLPADTIIGNAQLVEDDPIVPRLLPIKEGMIRIVAIANIYQHVWPDHREAVAQLIDEDGGLAIEFALHLEIPRRS